MKIRTEYTCPLERRLLKMNVSSNGIIGEVIRPQYGGHGTQFNENGIPTYSLPFTVENAPKETVSLAIVLEDKDAYPVTGGFVWIHWLAANITRFEIKENESQTADDFVQRRNSWTSIQGGEQSAELSSYYGGMTPPELRSNEAIRDISWGKFDIFFSTLENLP